MAHQDAEQILQGLEQEQQQKAHSAWEPANISIPKKSVRPQIYIGNISYGSNQDDLQNYFAKFGEVASLVLSKTKRKPDGTQGHRGFAFLAYADKSIVNQIINQKHSLGGRELTVNEAKPKTVKFFVGGLNKEKTTESTLRTYFSAYGEITDCFCVISRGFGFVTLIDEDGNIERITEKQRHEIDGTMCDVKPAKKKEDMGQGGRGGRGRGGRGGFRGRGRGGRGRGERRNSYGGQGGYGQQYSPYSQKGGNNYQQSWQQPQQNSWQQPQQNAWQQPQQNSWQQPQQQQQNAWQQQPQQQANTGYQQQNTWQQPAQAQAQPQQNTWNTYQQQ